MSTTLAALINPHGPIPNTMSAELSPTTQRAASSAPSSPDTATVQRPIMIGVGGYAVSNQPGAIIKTMALGSCVSVVAVDTKRRIAGMVHIALPESSIDPARAAQLPGYFADTGLRVLFGDLKKLGVTDRKDLVIKVAGGANVMDPKNMFNIGKRNALMVRKLLWKNRLGARAEDVGGSFSRTVWVEVDSGRMFLHSPGRGDWEL